MEENLMNTLDDATQLRHALKAVEELTLENKELTKQLNLNSVISCFLKETKEAYKNEYDTISIQMRGNELQAQGHKAIPYGNSWGKWLIKESSILNNL